MGNVKLTSYADAERGIWGSGASGFTVDWTYFLDEDVCQIVFGLPPGGRFTQLDDAFDVYHRDTVWRVLSGRFVAANPVTGEVHRLVEGDALIFRGEIWHHGFAEGAEPVHVMEFTAPPPTRIERLAERRALPAEARYDLALDAPSPDGEPTARVARAGDRALQPSLENGGLPVAEVLATSNLTVGDFELRSGERTDVIEHGSARTLYLQHGSLAVELPSEGRWIEVGERDGVHVGPGVPHRLTNIGAGPASGLLQLVYS